MGKKLGQALVAGVRRQARTSFGRRVFFRHMEAKLVELRSATENMMALYMIAYELHDGEDYQNLIEGIKHLPSGGSWHNLGSTWFLISKEAAVQIHNSLKRHLLDGDKLAVIQCGHWGAWSGFNDEASGWLKEAFKDTA